MLALLLWHRGSTSHGLSCPKACRILVPRPGIEPASPALEGRFLTTGPQGKSLFYFLFLVTLLLLFFFLFSFFAMLCSLQDLGPQGRGWAWAPVVGAPSPNHWINREPQTPGNINRSEVSQRSSSRHQDLALPNCLQTPVLEASGQTTSMIGTQSHPSKKNEMTKKYVTDEEAR